MKIAINQNMTGKLIKLNATDTNISVLVCCDEKYQTKIIAYEVTDDLLKIMKQDKNCFIIVKVDNGDILSLYDVCIMKESTDTFVPDISSKYTIEMLTTNVIEGKMPLSLDSMFVNFMLEITEGVELIGLCPYNINDIYIDIVMMRDFTLPFKIETTKATTSIGTFSFYVLPIPQFSKEKIEFGFEQRIDFTSSVPLGILELRPVFDKIVAFFELLCGESITINKLKAIISDSENQYDVYDYIGYCNYPKQHLVLFHEDGFDMPAYLRQSLFKITDFQSISSSLETWFEMYNKMDLSNNAYRRILLDENVHIVTANRFLAAMQLIEGYISATNDDSSAVKTFSKNKKKYIKALSDQAMKDFFYEYCNYHGETFKAVLKQFTMESLRILSDITEIEFDDKYSELLKSLKTDRDVYTHSSQRNKPHFNLQEIIRIVAIYKQFYRLNLLSRLGVPPDLIQKRFSYNRAFVAYLEFVFEIILDKHGNIEGFDKLMWHFS